MDQNHIHRMRERPSDLQGPPFCIEQGLDIRPGAGSPMFLNVVDFDDIGILEDPRLKPGSPEPINVRPGMPPCDLKSEGGWRLAVLRKAQRELKD